MPDDRIQDEPDKRPRPKRPRPSEDEEERPRRARRDDEDRPRRRRREEDDDGGMNMLIPYKNPKALASYYCGVFALIPCIGLVLGTIAIIFGVLGLKYRKTHETAGGTAHAWAGICLGTFVLLAHLATVVFSVVAWKMGL